MFVDYWKIPFELGDHRVEILSVFKLNNRPTNGEININDEFSDFLLKMHLHTYLNVKLVSLAPSLTPLVPR